jgi:hypothetical protein
MTDLVMRMKTLPDLTNEKAWETVLEGAKEIERLRDALANLGNAAAIVFSKFEPTDGPGEAAKAMLKMELGLKAET